MPEKYVTSTDAPRSAARAMFDASASVTRYSAGTTTSEYADRSADGRTMSTVTFRCHSAR